MSFIRLNSDNVYSASMSSNDATEFNTDPILTTNQFNTVVQAATYSPTFPSAYLFSQMTVFAQPSPVFADEGKTAEEKLFEQIGSQDYLGRTYLIEALIDGNAKPIREVTEDIMPEGRLEQPMLQCWSDMRTAQDANLAESIETNLKAIIAAVVKERSSASGAR